MEYTKANETAQQIIGSLRFAGFRAEIAGGVYKSKPSVHDIDIVVENARVYKGIGGSAIDLISMCALSAIKDIPDADRVPIEFYITTPEHFDRLLLALRSHRCDVIKGRLMTGLKFRKFTY